MEEADVWTLVVLLGHLPSLSQLLNLETQGDNVRLELARCVILVVLPVVMEDLTPLNSDVLFES